MPSNVSRSRSAVSAAAAASGSGAIDPLTRPQRLLVGLLILLLVDVIWVASSEFTKYIFTELSYDKPYFSTYFKNSLFITYLLGFVVYRPWRDLCSRDANQFRSRLRRRQGRYRRILQDETVENDERDALSTSSGADTEDDYGTSGSSNGDTAVVGTNRHSGAGTVRSLSSPTFVPANIPAESSKSSGAEDESDIERRDVIESDANSGVTAGDAAGPGPAVSLSTAGVLPALSPAPQLPRRVRFKQLAEVVEMNPAEAIAANLSRLSYNASLRAQMALRRAASRLTVREVVKISFIFSFPFFAGNYCYQRALSLTEAAVVNVLSASSSVFTLILSGVFPSEPSDKLTVSKFFAVAFNFSGVVLVSYSDIERHHSSDLPGGVMWALSGAFFYATYIVLLRRKVNNEDNMDPPMFFGFVGLFTTAMMWPGLLVLQGLKEEQFEWPSSKQLEYLVVNGLIGTVLSELLWLCGCFYTSSLIATLAMGLTIPLSIAADVFWKQKSYHPIFVIGAIPMFCSFFIIVLLTHYQDWDPLMDLFNRCCFSFKRCCGFGSRSSGHNNRRSGAVASLVLDNPDEQESLLIENEEIAVAVADNNSVSMQEVNEQQQRHQENDADTL